METPEEKAAKKADEQNQKTQKNPQQSKTPPVEDKNTPPVEDFDDFEISEDNNYIPAEEEKGFYHVILDKKGYDGQTGKKLFKPFVKKMKPKEFQAFQKGRKATGFDMEILWTPKEAK